MILTLTNFKFQVLFTMLENINESTSTTFLKTSPMLDQYLSLKNQVPDAVLLFRSGDFYEMFGQEALKMAQVLDIRQTSRNKNDPDNSVELCGFPHRSSKTYIQKLLKNGYKVAIAEQMQSAKDPTVKGLIKRQIVKIYTPGCQDDISDEDEQNYILAIYQDPTESKWIVLISDISTGELKVSSCSDDRSIMDLIQYIKPKEILARKFLLDELKNILTPYLNYNKNLCFSTMEEEPLRNTYYQSEVIDRICGRDKESLTLVNSIKGASALIAGFIKYLEFLHINTDRFLSIKPIKDPGTMILTETERRDLELFETIRTAKTTGSLFHEIKRTLSPMGTRLLRKWILYPLMNQEEIIQRQLGCQSFIDIATNYPDMFVTIKDTMSGFPDMERLSIKLTSGYLNITQILNLKASLLKVKKLYTLLDSQKSDLSPIIVSSLKNLSSYHQALSIFNSMIKDNATEIGNGDQLIKEGYDPKLDEYNNLAKHGESKILDYESKLRASLDLPLKIKKHATLGLLIEVSKNKTDRVPSFFVKRQSMTNFDRYSTEDLSKLNADISQAQELALQKEAELYQEFISKLRTCYVDLIKMVRSISLIDALFSFSQCAIELNYHRPTFSDRICLQGSRHPSIERMVGQSFTANDITIEGSSKIMLITGPNMGGKSTVMRQVALISILAQIGSYVPASSAELPIFDRIFTRVGASDDISAGQSTFMVEMSQTASILRNATTKSLIILDEIGRGTSTQDGLALASAILEDLSLNKKAFCFFTTHYHELVRFSSNFTNICIYQTQVLQENSKIIFTHKLIPGASGESFGIEVARLAGIPQSVLKRASDLQASYHTRMDKKDTQLQESSSISQVPESEPQPIKDSLKEINSRSSLNIPSCLFQDETDKFLKIIDKLRTININRTTPIKALTILDDIKSMIDSSETTQKNLFD